ncbi:MAG: hypothetical protein Q9188_002984 [Gyalolechia gomerana]
MVLHTIVTAEKPCLQCKDINPYSAYTTGASIKHLKWLDQYPEFPALKSSAENGCAFCGLLRHALLHKYSDAEIKKAEDDFDESVQDEWSTAKWRGNVEIYGGRFGTEGDVAPSRAAGETRDEWFSNSILNVSFNIWPYPPRRQHEESARWDGQRIWFNVYRQSANSSRDPKLIVTSGEIAPYVALSHCWGRPPQSAVPRNARTVSTNFQNMLAGIPIDSVPRNFQDAIQTVRALGLRYLWIDALCIIQDSVTDWETEAARMQEVYGSAYLTLAGTSATSSIDGFIARSQWPWPVVSMPGHGKGSPSSSKSVYFRYQPDYSKYSRIEAIDNSVWNTRGWTFQERLLSSRILHFASGRLYWECRTTEGSEENEPARSLDYRTPWMATEAGNTREMPIYPDVSGVDNRYQRWYRLVSMYSQRDLSFREDVLPALSGLAHAFHHVYTNKDTYVAGLWLHDLMRGLLWMTKDSSKATRTLKYGSPSWSWASINGEVDWPSRTTDRHCHYNYTAKLLNPQTTVGFKDPMGATPGGIIKLLGRYQQLAKVVKPSELSFLARFPFDLISAGEIIGNGSFDVDSEIQTDNVWMLQIELQGPGDSFFPYHPIGLLLRRVDGGACQFSRIGFFTLNEECIEHFDSVEPKEIVLV